MDAGLPWFLLLDHKVLCCQLSSPLSSCKGAVVAHSCLTLCDPIDCSLPGSSVHCILQARTLEWVKVLAAQLYLTLCDPRNCVAHQVALSMEFSRQEYWNGLPFPSPGDLPNPGIEPGSPALQADSLPSEPPKALSTLQIVDIAN